jgi:hypothetical protein
MLHRHAGSLPYAGSFPNAQPMRYPFDMSKRPRSSVGDAMTLGNMRENGVRRSTCCAGYATTGRF